MSIKKLSTLGLQPMSTVCFNLCISFIGLLCFILFLNPLMMLVFHQFAPKFASGLAHNRFFCGKTICRFYTKMALKWPFKWSKWWITVEDLDKLSDEEQKIYYRDVSWSDDVRDALRPKVWAKIMKNEVITYSNRDNFVPVIKKRDDLFAALLDVAYETQKEVRLLHSYIQYGTLPKSQMLMLVERACAKDKPYEFDELMNELCFYIDRCGIRKDLLNKIAKSETLSQSFKDTIELHNEMYRQKTLTCRLYRLESVEQIDAWAEFCATTKKIYVPAQEEMSINQYGIFLKHGHHLDPDAIAHLLWYRDADMAKQIFANEPKFGMLNDKIKFVMKKHDYLTRTLNKVVESTRESLCQRIYAREELSVEELNKVFDCPEPNDLLVEYFAYYPLPKELHKRLLEPENDGALWFYITQSWLLKAYQLDDEVAKECEKRGLRLDPPEED